MYLGGGTPSSLELAQLERIVGGVRRVLPVRADARITLFLGGALPAGATLDFEPGTLAEVRSTH